MGASKRKQRATQKVTLKHKAAGLGRQGELLDEAARTLLSEELQQEYAPSTALAWRPRSAGRARARRRRRRR